MDKAQLDKLSYVSRHVDDLFDQRIQQFDAVYDAQIGWLQEFVSGKEATLKQQLEVLQTPKSKYPRRANATYAAPTPMKEFQYQPSAPDALRVPFTPIRPIAANANLPVDIPQPAKVEEIPFKTPSLRGNGKKASAKAAAPKEEKAKEEEIAQSQQEFKAPGNRKNTFKRTAAKGKTSPKPAPESNEDVMEVDSQKEKTEDAPQASNPPVEEVRKQEEKMEAPVLGESALPPAPSRPGTLRGEEPVEVTEPAAAPAIVVATEANASEEVESSRPARGAAARRGAFKKKEEAREHAADEEPTAARTRSARSKRGVITTEITASTEVVEIVAAPEPKRRGRPKKAAAAPVAEPEHEIPAADDQVAQPELNLDQDAKKKRKISENVVAEIVQVQPASPKAPAAPSPAKILSPVQAKPSTHLSEDEIVIEAESEAITPAAQEEAPIPVVIAEAAFASPVEAEPVSATPEQQKKRPRSNSPQMSSRSPAPSTIINEQADPSLTPESFKRRKLSTATDAASEPQTPPPDVPVLPTEEVFSGSKKNQKSTKHSKSPSVLAEAKRTTRSQKSSPVSFVVSAPPSYAESLELLRKELPEIEAVLRMDREEAAAAGIPASEAPTQPPAPADDKMDAEPVADAQTTEEPRRISGKRKRSSADRSSIASESSSTAAPNLVSSSSSDNLIQPRANGSSMAPPAGSSRANLLASKVPAAGKAAAAQKGAVDEKLKKVIENRNQKEQERIQKQLEKIKKQEEKQSRIAEQKTAATVQDKVKEAQRRKEELKKKQQEKKKPAAVAAAPVLTKKASAEEISAEQASTEAPAPVETEMLAASKGLTSKPSSSTAATAAGSAAPTASVPPAPVVKDTPSKGSSIKQIFAALNPLALLSSFGSAKKQKPQEELPKPSFTDDEPLRRQSAPGSPSVSKSPLFSLTSAAVEAAKSPSRASTGSNHEAFDEPPSASKKGKKKSKTPKKPASAKKVKQLFGWNKPSTLTQEPLPVPNLQPSTSSTVVAKKVNLSPSDLPSPGPPPAMSKSAAEIMPPPKLPAIGSPSWIRLQTKEQPAAGSPYQSPEKPKQQGKFHQSPEFQYKIDEYSSDQDSPEKMMGPEWTKKEQLWEALIRQSSVDPDDVFGTDFPKTCDLAEIFATDRTSAEDRRRYRHRTSSGNWTKDKLNSHEDLHYKKRMGFYRSPTK